MWNINGFSIYSYQNCSLSGHVMMVDLKLMLDHLQYAVFKWSTTKVILDVDQVVVGAFDVKNIIHSSRLTTFPVLISFVGQIEYFLLSNGNGIVKIQTAKVDMLKLVVFLVDFIKNLPGHFKFYSLFGFFHFPV